MSAQEASILLGLRPSTLPSTAVEHGLENGDTGALADLDEGTIGTGGGGARRKGRAARGRGRGRGGARGGGRDGDAAAGAPLDTVVVPAEFADADPYVSCKPTRSILTNRNEPRYCYCNQISYGEVSLIFCTSDPS